jgi:hypothetical protein
VVLSWLHVVLERSLALAGSNVAIVLRFAVVR